MQQRLECVGWDPCSGSSGRLAVAGPSTPAITLLDLGQGQRRKSLLRVGRDAMGGTSHQPTGFTSLKWGSAQAPYSLAATASNSPYLHLRPPGALP
ncbi:hypothetical protein HaLaN_03875 [Haematococcus lacustris]|uniref:Uncharacterized protein n=1 Tax=Haematococcus lacustris TaxID=44745 RepID=A0A699YQ26_HAELA|nr:hypothetical protein HaLaN_03875 [Haematococcus lacustris]